MIQTGITFDKEFEELCEGFASTPDGLKLLELSGLSLEKMDVGHMSHKYFQDNWSEHTIEHNANSVNKSPINYSMEITKPTMKLIGMYLIHRYLRKEFGKERADKIVGGIINGKYYVHDASGVGIQIPYSYTAHEIVTVKLSDNIMNIPMKMLFDILSEEYFVESTANGKSWVSPENLMVMDGGVWVPVTHVMEKVNVRKMLELRMSDGSHQIVTDNHPIITTDGEKDAIDVRVGDLVRTEDVYHKHTISSFKCFELTEDIGYLVGMIVGDGWEYGDTIFISQKKGTAIRERIESTLKDNCIHYIEVAGHTDRIAISDKRFVNFIAKCDLGHMSENRRMPHFWVNAPEKFLVGLVAGLFDAEGSLGGANKNLPQVRMTGRTAVLQTREILSALGCTSTISAYGPYNRDGSFKSNHRMYSLVMKFNDGAASEIRAFSEKLSGIEYSSTRGAHKVDGRGIVTVQKIVEHPQFIDRVYDITTSTGTFTCNGIHSHNCYAWSTHWLMGCGIPTGQLVSKPPKHAASFIGQVAEVVMEMSQEFAGAVAPADLLVAYAYYAERDGLTDKEIENHLQSFVHIVNRQFRTGAQSPFTNVSVFDRPNLENLFKDMVYPDGSKINYEYVEHVQEIFLNWFSKGTSNGTPFRFPVATINGTKDENNNIVDKKFLKMISRCNTPLACFNLHFAEGSKLAMCCRYINDPARMRQFGADSFGNGGLNIGSHRIVLLNIPRAAYQAHGDTDSLFRQIDEYMDDARDILIVHRERILGKRIDQGFLKWFNVGVASLNKMFSTFGFTGIPEAVQTMGLDPQSREGVELGKKILKHMDKRAAEISIETGYAFNIEEVPGESAAINLADKDRLFFTDDVKVDMYSNQFVPLAADVPLTTRIAIEGELMSTVSGGAITHINLDEKITNPEIMEKLITYVVSKGVTHFAINYGFTLCEKDGGFAGLREKCPKCGSADVEHMTRVVGYFVPVKSWTKKRQEKDFPNRTKYSIGDLK